MVNAIFSNGGMGPDLVAGLTPRRDSCPSPENPAEPALASSADKVRNAAAPLWMFLLEQRGEERPGARADWHVGQRAAFLQSPERDRPAGVFEIPAKTTLVAGDGGCCSKQQESA